MNSNTSTPPADLLAHVEVLRAIQAQYCQNDVKWFAAIEAAIGSLAAHRGEAVAWVHPGEIDAARSLKATGKSDGYFHASSNPVSGYVPLYAHPPQAPRGEVEPVAWQYRFKFTSGEWSGWATDSRDPNRSLGAEGMIVTKELLLLKEVDTLRRQLAEAEQDARRYREARLHLKAVDIRSRLGRCDETRHADYLATVDSAIDAAIAAVEVKGD